MVKIIKRFLGVVTLTILGIGIVLLWLPCKIFEWTDPKEQKIKKSKIKSKFYQVPEEDYELLKFLHINLAKGEKLEILECDRGRGNYWHARALYDYWGMSPEEILQETGFWIEEPQLKETKNG